MQPKFSQSADRNRKDIAAKLRARVQDGATVLEIASGTGQHMLHFSEAMPDIIWQPSDRSLEEFELRETVLAASRANLLAPLQIDVSRFPDFQEAYDAVYSANCIHVMSSANLEPYIAGAAKALKPGGMMMLYGPFKYDGEFTTPSNEQFDAFLRGTYDDGGIRDFARVDELAEANGLSFHSDSEMPANNQFIIWRKTVPAG
ncbi:DUF938 domain-containing protein [Ahrensia sp. R2A130]|uniref:DUF938 domain-containing protein n=1 Tax=Ahrensia sp. R2A130 TaxID=744979 RepID=UPI0001E0C315|nr:DUF938 domain-containing protein [Ahrensia sp. R2A130]EFL90230.1 hypothetical protein R2A130_0301 [Ahrensia sp. R2A130]